MSKNVVCYVRRRLITDWKRKVLTRTDSAFVYGSNDKNVFAKLNPGDVLWIVASVPSRPPEIVARLEVEIVAQRDDPALGVSEKLLKKFYKFEWIARGGKESRFFGHNNAERAFMVSEFLSSGGRRWRLGEDSCCWKSEYGIRFLRPVELCPPGIDLFKQTTEAPAIFISWKWKDNQEELIRALAYALADLGFTVWLDKLAMPASRALQKLKGFPEALEMLLQDGYQKSCLLLAIGSKLYGTISENSAKNWTLEEWNRAFGPHHPIQRRVFCPAYSEHSTVFSQEELYLKSSNPLEAAVELRNWFNQTISPSI
jgi:hypothetical protein